MSEEPITQADSLRTWIENKIKEKFDYSKASYKKNDRIAFCNAHPEFKATEKSIRSHHNKILDEIGPKNGKTPNELGKKVPKVSSTMLSSKSDMDSSIEPVPQPEIPGTIPSGPQIPGQPPTPDAPYINPNMTVDSIGAIAQGGMAGIKAILPELELLTEEEQKSIGAILLPPLSRISDERIQLYLLPILGVLGIVGPKIAKARGIRKEKKIREKQEKEIKEADKETKDD